MFSRALRLLVGCDQWELSPEAGARPRHPYLSPGPTVVYVLKTSQCCSASHHSAWVPAFYPHLCMCSLNELPLVLPVALWVQPGICSRGLNERCSEMTQDLRTSEPFITKGILFSHRCEPHWFVTSAVLLQSITELIGTKHWVSQAKFCGLKSAL